ncbi:MAG: chemotaxis protein CheW [Myxococcota bacterium]
MDEIGGYRARLAEAFDHAFTLPSSNTRTETRDFLVLRLSGYLYAIAVDEIAGVQNKKAIRFLPDAPPHCLGLANVGGRMGAVYDLAGLLGSPSSDRMAWFLQTRSDPDLAFLVPKADRYLRVPLARILPNAEPDGAVIAAITEGNTGVNVLSGERLVSAIRERCRGRVP